MRFFQKRKNVTSAANPINRESRGAKLLWQGQGTESLVGFGAKPRQKKARLEYGV